MNIRPLRLLAVLVLLAGSATSAPGEPPDVPAALKLADRLFKDQHWAEAGARYDFVRSRVADWHDPAMRRAVEGAVACSIKLEQWDGALSQLEAYIDHNPDTLNEVAGQRLLAHLYLAMPHKGITQGGRFLRGESGQGLEQDREQSDGRVAIEHLERARDVAARLALAQPANAPDVDRLATEQERIGTDFDLTTVLTRMYATATSRHYLDQWLGIRLPPGDKGPENPDDVTGSINRPSYDPREPPAGIPPRPDGTLWFTKLPPSYRAELTPAEKFLFLLTEIERLDTSPQRDAAADAVFRRAALAQHFYGPEIAQAWVEWWRTDRTPRLSQDAYGVGKGPEPPVPETKIWQLRDDQALVPVGSWLRVVDLPADESPLALLAAAETRYPQSTLLPEVRYARALYHRSRQQFPQALAEFQAIIEQFPASPRAKDARAQIQEIEKPGVAIGETETYFPGEPPRLTFTARNAETVRFTATRFDLLRFADESDGSGHFGGYRGGDFFEVKTWRKYLGKETVRWSETIPPGQENRLVEGSTLAPVTAPGTYVIEAQVAGNKDPARVFVVVTDILLLRKTVHDNDRYTDLLMACDARTGRPLPNCALHVYEHWKDPDRPARKGREHVERQTFITDENGAVFYRRKHSGQSSSIDAVMLGKEGRIAFSSLASARGNAPPADGESGDTRHVFLVTDRPVYRPGATVRYCAWLRTKHGGVYQLPPPGPILVRIEDAKRRQVSVTTAQIDEAGMVHGEYTLGSKASLGLYSIFIANVVPAGAQPDNWQYWGDNFRVEEYRQPEFEVNVRPSTTQARLGEKFKATVEARYYFGAPVTQARVSYKVYREVFSRSYFEPGEFDGIYGKGYGLELYRYPWLPWWARWGGQIGWGGGRLAPRPMPDWQEELDDPRELVAQGETTLDAEGRCEVEVDTARAKAEHGEYDHQYTVEATVIGSNRRAVEGTGSVVATRQGFYAFVETERGWYAAGDEARLRIRALTPGNVPVTVKGQMIVSRIRYDGPNHAVVTEEEVKRWDAETDTEGRLSSKLALPDEGQYHVAFHARDGWGQEVQGNAVLWVQGPKFDGRMYRSNELEIIADKRSYRVGETAHLLINTAGDNARVIFANHEPDGVPMHLRFIDVPQRSTIIDVPINESCVPNVAVEATVVHNGNVYTEVCELVVPPQDKLLNLSVRTDKDVYQPGEKGTVYIEATDKTGKPVAGHVTLTAFDKAVTYIEPESVAVPDGVFYEKKSFYQVEFDSSFNQGFSAEDASNTPQDYPNATGVTEGWKMSWKLGFGMRESPLLRFLRDGISGFGVEQRIVITGSNIPTTEQVSPPTLLGEVAAPRPGTTSTAGTSANLRGTPFDYPAVNHPPTKLIEPEIRTRFADTALWLPALKLDANGKADAEIEFPQSLTTWRVHGYAINAATQVGDATAQAVTTRKLLVRLLSPRFFTERDEVVLSAAVNNYLPEAKDVTAELILPAAQFQPMRGSAPPAPDADGNMHLTAKATIAPNSEHRFDWTVNALQPGMATITVRALTDQESDGMRLAFPVQVHGISKSLVQSGSFRVGQDGDRTLHFDVPVETDPTQTQLEISLSPGLAGVMIDALPYLADYPYGCVEQTLSRFYPSVLVRDTLKRTGTNLEALGNQRRQMNPADLANRFDNSPVYDSARLDRMIRDGLTALYDAQHTSGGWGWWGGEDPSLYQTAYVLQGLQAARTAGVSLDESIYRRGFEYLWLTVSTELAKPIKKQSLGDVQQQAYCAYVLSLEPLSKLEGYSSNPDLGIRESLRSKWLDRLYAGRGELNNQGRAMLALALHHARRDEQARTVLRNLLQFVDRDDSNETAWVRTPANSWWFWWNNDIETNAWALKALVALDPKNGLAPRLVKWLLNNRRNGSYWRSTRDTAQVLSAMTDYLLASGEGAPDYLLTVSVDGEEARNVHVTPENLFSFDNKVVLNGLRLKPGPHAVTIHKVGAGALYYACQLTYFTTEEGVKGVGDEIGIERQYCKLVPTTTTLRQPINAAESASARAEQRAGYHPVLLKDGDELASGDLLEATLKITSKNTYDYLAFEDPKPAGCEPVEVRSGGQWQEGFCANVELRDTKTVFFVELLEQGAHFLRYRLRAETPGKFHVLPATGSAMYAPELRANSDETHIGIRE